jgi:hypothetical protein
MPANGGGSDRSSHGRGDSRGDSGGGGNRSGRSGGNRGRDYSSRDDGARRDRSRNDRSPDPRDDRRKPLTIQPGAPLPKWVREEITRSTPKDRRDAALIELTKGLESFADDRPRQAVISLRKAKDLSPRAATVREILGLAAYQVEAWEEALRELRTFRRITGETMHMAVELDCLRALGRDSDVDKTFQLFGELGGDRDSEDEVCVVYASHLLDRGRPADAWKVIKPGRLVANPPIAAVRRWAVAARVAAASGDRDAARMLYDAVRRESPDIEWLADLESELGI